MTTTDTRCLRVGAVQMVSGGSVSRNLGEAERLIAAAVGEGAELVALPENFALMPPDESARRHAAEADGSGTVQEFLGAQARGHGVWIIGGTISLRAAERLRSSCLVFNDQGERVARYDKIHLFDATLKSGAYAESASFEAGNDVTVFPGPRFRVGLAVCYDLRFPSQFERLALQGAELIVVPSAFTEETGRAHWELLVRTRSIDTLAFVVAPAQGGVHENGRRTYGDTLITSPWGEVLGRVKHGAGYVVTDLDAARLLQARERLPALNRGETHADRNA
ncbi:MAG: carbon-nitrogen hydrolase family protein [Acidiferrobacteraceae bacterium]